MPFKTGDLVTYAYNNIPNYFYDGDEVNVSNIAIVIKEEEGRVYLRWIMKPNYWRSTSKHSNYLSDWFRLLG